MLDKIMVARRSVIRILLRSNRFPGVVLSLRAFLKSLMMLLNDIEPLEAEDIEDPAIDI